MHVDQATRLREIAYKVNKDAVRTPSPHATSHAKIYAITSGKGGVGKTNLSVNLAIALAKKGKRVTLVDLDLGLANVDILLDLTSPYTLEHLILGYKTIKEIIVEGPEGIKIVPGGSGLPNLTDLGEIQRQLFLDSFYTLTLDNDYLIFDTAAGISNNVIQFVLAADEVIVVTTEEPTAITDAYALIKVIGLQNKECKINFVLNMVKSCHEARHIFSKVRSVVKQFLGIEMYDFGYVVYDSCVSDAIMRRKPFITQYPFSSASKSVKDVAKALMQKANTHRSLRRNFFQKMSQLFLG